MSRKGTCIIEASYSGHVDIVVWMLNNGSSIDENTRLDFRGNVVPTKSCEEVLKEKGLYEEVKSVLTTKSSRK